MTSKKTTRDSVIITPERSKTAQAPQSPQEDGFRSLFENAVIGIFRSTVDGGFIEANPALAAMLGYRSPDELVSEVSDLSGVYADPGSRKTIINAALANGGRLLRWEERLKRGDGGTFTASLNIRVISDENGGPSRMEGFVEDISDQKLMHEAIRESEDRFKAVFEASNAGFAIFDRLGRLVSANQSFLNIFGVQNISDIIGSRLFDLPYIDEKARQMLNERKTLRKDLEFDFEEIARYNVFQSEKKGRICLDASIKALCEEDEKTPTGYLLQVQDITEIKHHRMECQKIKAELEACKQSLSEAEKARPKDKHQCQQDQNQTTL
ncbi:MAG: PAS domain-containing protein [Candidatus Altiarchaeota archaeon]